MGTYNVSSAADIITAINAGSGGSDLINIAAGNYDCTASVLAPRPGCAIVGAGRLTATLKAKWQNDLGGGTLIMQDFTTDCTGLAHGSGAYGTAEFYYGTFRFDRIGFTGQGLAVPGNNHCTFASTSSGPFTAILNGCVSTGAYNDAFSAKSNNGSDAFAAASKMILVNCEASDMGHSGGTSEQAVTSHSTIPVWDFGGYYYGCRNAGQYIIAADDYTTPIVLVGTRVVGGHVNCASAYHCNFDLQFSLNTQSALSITAPNGVLYGCKIVAYNSTNALECAVALQDTATNALVAYNYISKNASIASGCTILGGTIGSTACVNNYILCNNRLIKLDTGGGQIVRVRSGGATVSLFNNIMREGPSVAYNYGGGSTFAGDYNILAASAGSYTPNTHDITAVAGLDADGTPTIGGNCDYNGSSSQSVGSPCDLLGRPLFPIGPRCRGPIERGFDVAGLTVRPSSHTKLKYFPAVAAGQIGGLSIQATNGSVQTDAAAALTTKTEYPNTAATSIAADYAKTGEATAAASALKTALETDHGDGQWDATSASVDPQQVRDAMAKALTEGTTIEAGSVDAMLADISGSIPPSLLGTGSVTVPLLCEVNGVPVDGMEVSVSTDIAGENIVAGPLYSNAFGRVRFRLDSGTYYLWRQLAGKNLANPLTITVP